MQDLEEEVQENLELPDIYENTIIYNGTINPELNLWVELPGYEPSDGPGEEPEGQETPYVNEAGQFSMILITEDLQAGDEIVFAFNAPETETYRQTIEVQPAQDGMEIVESSMDTSELQDTVIEATEINWLDDNVTPAFEMNTVGDVEYLPLYSIGEESLSEENVIEHIDQNLYRANFTEDQLSVGETITVYIVASGVTTPLEVEVPDTLTSLQDANEEEPIESDESNEETEDEDPDEEPGDQDDESDVEEDDMDEIDSPETEDGADEDEGISTAWIVVGVVLVLAVIGGIVYLVQRKRQ